MKFEILDLNFCDFKSGFNLNGLNPLQKRRLSIPSKCIYTLIKNSVKFNMPCVFASNYGEFHRCLNLLSGLSLTNSVSPTSFSLSVLNSALATFFIKHEIHSPLFAISSENLVEDAVICAYSKLLEFNEICVICYEEVPFSDEFYSSSFIIKSGNSISLEISQEKIISNLVNLENFRENFGKDFSWSGREIGYRWKFL
ncbi:beta-ketoacyl synthase chain length factor [Campylobacter portucalensis]|nr:beta-ketoacyl synthase chain length factor [Campylobacter portucalensis]